jgi:hypothetical protein
MPGSADKHTQSAQGRLLWPGMTPIMLWFTFKSVVIASVSEAIQKQRRKRWIASAFAKKLRRTGRRKRSSQ